MNFVILDLEWNGTYCKRLKSFMNEIIEFGAVKVDKDLNVIDTFEALVRPQVGKKISGKIKTLTSITNEDLKDGMQFMQAVSKFKKWCGDAVLMTWGTSDILVLTENCKYFSGDERIPFLKWYVDLQSYCEKMLDYDHTKQIGLSTAAQLLNIDEEKYDHHRALGDSLLSLKCFQKLYDQQKFPTFLKDAGKKEFYDKLLFKTVIICDLDHPLIKQSSMNFNCDHCGHRAHRISEWVLKNKAYRAVFICHHCKHKFCGRIQFKLKYEGIVIKKAILPVYTDKDDKEDKEPQEES